MSKIDQYINALNDPRFNQISGGLCAEVDGELCFCALGLACYINHVPMNCVVTIDESMCEHEAPDGSPICRYTYEDTDLPLYLKPGDKVYEFIFTDTKDGSSTLMPKVSSTTSVEWNKFVGELSDLGMRFIDISMLNDGGCSFEGIADRIKEKTNV